MQHPIIIGAGGVASYLLPVLLKTFRPAALTLIDKDILEERNLDRQMFDAEYVGKNKAWSLWQTTTMNDEMGDDSVNILEDWFTDSTVLLEDVDAIICCADNHEARYAAIKRANDLGIYAYIGGNEYLDSQAYVYHRDWVGTKRDPLVRYPNIATSLEGSPINCTGEAQVASPQLAIANFSCAAKLLHLLWIYERWLPQNRHLLSKEAVEGLTFELFTSQGENSQLP